MPTATNEAQKRVLVVDDDSTMVEYVSAVLRREGYQVEIAADGMTALEMYRAGAFDAVVCDVRMPKLSGISFLKNLRLTANPACRVVLLSAMDDQNIRREAYVGDFNLSGIFGQRAKHHLALRRSKRHRVMRAHAHSGSRGRP